MSAIDPWEDAPALDGQDLIRLKDERKYLDRAVAGEVQLYLYDPQRHNVIEMIGLYDPQRHNVIEMIGKPSAETARTLTYVPGTFTSDTSFFRDEIQDVARYLVKQDPTTVAFVWKDGPFPGEDTPERPSTPLGVLEANIPILTRVNSLSLKEFESGLRSSSEHLAAVDHIAAGHSWGLTPITDAETLDVHYDQVHSLAGAGMPEAWKPDDQAEYHHWTYGDALMEAQATGLVWSGNNPWGNPAFESHFYISDADLVPTSSLPAIGERLVENHNLVASNDPPNQLLLRQLLATIGQ